MPRITKNEAHFLADRMAMNLANEVSYTKDWPPYKASHSACTFADWARRARRIQQLRKQSQRKARR